MNSQYSPVQQYRYPNRLYLKCLPEEGRQLRHDVFLIGESFLRVQMYAPSLSGNIRLAPLLSSPIPGPYTRPLCLAPYAWPPMPGPLCLAPYAWPPMPGLLCLAPYAWPPMPGPYVWPLCLAPYAWPPMTGPYVSYQYTNVCVANSLLLTLTHIL